MADIQTAFNYCVQACNDNYIGYSQGPRRTTIKLGVTYNTYCDCSSLMSWCLTNAGYFGKNPWFTTYNERDKLTAVGFTEHNPSTEPWQAGDILWRRSATVLGHTEMVYKGAGTGGYTMGAHNPHKAYADQVSINTYKSYGSDWMVLLRAPGGSPAVTYAWHQSNSYYDHMDDYMYGNAVLIHAYLQDEGFTDAAIAGILGNFERESTINPGLWQSLNQGNLSGGYGLAQWTPATKYTNYANANSIDMNDADENGPGQLDYLLYSVTQGEWMLRPSYGYTYSWADFKALTDPQEAASAFLYQYERPAVYTSEPVRRGYAQEWYDEMQSGWPSDPGSDVARSIIDELGGIIWDQRRRKVRP